MERQSLCRPGICRRCAQPNREHWFWRRTYGRDSEQLGYVCSTCFLVGTILTVTGGSPYDDLVKCWEYVRDNLDFVDTDNGVAAGASYGAFMINWIQGNPLGRKFKALVSHDGPFFGVSRYNTEELWFTQHEVVIHHPFSTPLLLPS